MNSSLCLEQCTAKITTHAHANHAQALQHMEIDLIHPTKGALGRLRALQIHRSLCHGRFLKVLAEPFELTPEVFDEFGRIKDDLVDNEYLKGTGVWGRELNHGGLVFLLSITVEKEFEGQGIASWLLQQLEHWQSTHAAPGTIILACPAPSAAARPEGGPERQDLYNIALFHKHHYRRVGRTSWLASTSDPAHPSRMLAPEDDVQSLSDTFKESPNRLHRKIPTFGSSDTASGIASYVRDAYLQEPALVRQQDHRGFTPLHTAAYVFNLPAVRELLALPAASGVAGHVRARDNIAGRTPLELCEQQMQSTREWAQRVRGRWDGHSWDALRIVYLLKRAAGEDVPRSEDTFIANRKWGCTCGRCTDGWLSERMRYRLLFGAEVDADTMDTDACDAPKGASFDEEFAVEHLPRAVRRRGITKGVYQGYAEVVRAISVVLRKPGIAGIPTADNIHSELAGGQGRRFFAKGGRVEHAMSCVLWGARSQSPLGDNTWDELQESWAADGDAESVAYMALPTCANDLEFYMVAQMLGVQGDGSSAGSLHEGEWEPEDEDETDSEDSGEER